jgi:hypothetical protein
LAVFDSDLAVRVPPGSDAADVLAALPQIKATGMATELYRSTMSAIIQLAISPASRRALFLFSGGLTEDTAYKIEDTVAAGRATDVAIYTFGFATTPPGRAVQPALRRLAQDTGGRYFAANERGVLPPAALVDPFEALDSGGRAYFGLTPQQFAAGGPVNIGINTAHGGASLDVVLPGLPQPPERGWRLWVREPANQAMVALGGAFVLGALALLIDRRVRRRRAYLLRLAAGHFDDPVAWLEELQGEGRHIGITGTSFRIGRNRDNDLVLPDSSVGGQHAVIARSATGAFSVTDLRSGKGVFVNLSQVQQAALHNGDIVELGQARFRFRATGRGLPDHAQSGEAALP